MTMKPIKGSLTVTSALYIVLGVVLISFPESSLKLVCTLIGVVTLVYGVTRIMNSGSSGDKADLGFGALLAAAGAFLVICPQFVVSLAPLALGIYVVIDGVNSIKNALDKKALGDDKWWISFAIAAVLTLLGVIMIFNPFGALSTLVKFIGFGLVLDGAYTLITTAMAKNAEK